MRTRGRFVPFLQDCRSSEVSMSAGAFRCCRRGRTATTGRGGRNDQVQRCRTSRWLGIQDPPPPIPPLFGNPKCSNRCVKKKLRRAGCSWKSSTTNGCDSNVQPARGKRTRRLKLIPYRTEYGVSAAKVATIALICILLGAVVFGGRHNRDRQPVHSSPLTGCVDSGVCP